MKTFKYLGFTFKPIRKFTKEEDTKGLTLNFYSIGISNYSDNPYQCRLSSEWDYTDFYTEAKKVGAGEMDVFLMNNKALVIPCGNELFAYGKDEAMKLPQPKVNNNGTICKSHITVLRKVARQLAYKQTMGYSQLILGTENTLKIEEAEQLLYKAMNILKTIN